ncbi:MAG: glycerol-3-phosphate acyltransferase [Acidimicrobiia bacterium]|nr:glycerol-3-phosphate acyltransferase [Acidimicrobiia bacterium]
MPELAVSVLFIAVAYLVGSIPFPLLIGNLKGVDVRYAGSGNIGAGNLTRTAGWPAGSAAAVLDVCKGILPFMVGSATGLGPGIVGTAGLAAVAGHDWPIFLGGRGGRGLATSTGVVLGLNPALVIWPAAWSMVGWKISGGLGGFVGWGLLPVYAAIAPFSATETGVAFGLAVLMMVRRAQGGEERAPGFKAAVRRIVFDTGWPGGGTERLVRA